MKKFIVPLVMLLVGLGLGFSIPHGANQPTKAGGVYNFAAAQHMDKGVYVGTVDQFSVDSSGNVFTTGTTTASTSVASLYKTATVGRSSTTPAALGSAAAGFFTATTTTQFASTTAVTANSQIIFGASPSSTAFTAIGVACNTVAPSSTQVTKIFPGNGFQVQTNPAPSGSVTPYCLTYTITN